jgi:hypothetical protein
MGGEMKLKKLIPIIGLCLLLATGAVLATITSETTRISYSGNGSTTVFAYPFTIIADGDLLVIIRDASGNETTQTLTSDYTVSGAGVDGGGNVTMVTAPASTETLTIMRNRALKQESDWATGGAFLAESLEADIDELTMIVQQLQEKLDRSIHLKKSSTLTDIEFSDFDAGEYVRVNTSGDGLDSVPAVQDLGNFTQSGTGAVSRTAISKMGEIFSVKDFGATGDGVADDSTAFQAAYDALGTNGGDILLPYGDYYVSTAITGTKSGVRFIGQGYPRYPTGGDPATRIKTDQAIYIFDLGSGTATNHGGPQFINITFQDSSGAGTALGAVRIKRMNHVRFVNCVFADFSTGYGVYLDGTGDAAIVPSLVDCKSRNTKFAFKGVLTTGVVVTRGFYAGILIASGIGFDAPELNLTNVAMDGWITAIKTGNDSKVALCRFENNDLAVQVASGNNHHLIANKFYGSDGDETGVQLDNGTSAIVMMGNIYSNLLTNITDNTAATAWVYNLDLLTATNTLQSGLASSHVNFTLHNYRQTVGEYTQFIAEGGRGGTIGKLEAHFDSTFDGAWVGASTNHPTYLISNNSPVLSVSSGGLIPETDDTYYLGEIGSPYKAYKALILKDTTDGKHYKIESINGVLTATALD